MLSEVMRERLLGVEDVLMDVMDTIDTLPLVVDIDRRLELARSAMQKINMANTVIFDMRTDVCSDRSLLKMYDGALAMSNEFVHRLRQHLPAELWQRAGHGIAPRVLVNRDPSGL